MGQPVKLSDKLVLDARLAAEAVSRSIAGQIEFWARIGLAVEPLLRGAKAMELAQRGGQQPLSESIATVDTDAGRERLAQHLRSTPFPHYESEGQRSGQLVRIEADGTRTVGRFVNRVFQTVDGTARGD